MSWLYTENVNEAAEILILLMGTFVAVASTYIFGTFLTANGSLKQLNIIALVGLGINLVLNNFLIPIYGPYGAAIATLITQLFVILSQILIVKRLLKWTVNFNYLLRLSIFSLLLLAMSYLFYQMSNTWIIKSLLTIILGFTMAIIFRIIEPQNMIRILKNKEQ